ncbi:hypothetical protein [Naasia lichenicola]|uniref:Lipoprotein n=1 Tax=Naasia lichenicola TaxID=2565933 RepID=A0A4S4FRI5_9MICO|nr:hypothetical protein [Naasia lichenicola]THG33259.1 hypothetical protein E6C64_02595 [Naasia lichenicola]
MRHHRLLVVGVAFIAVASLASCATGPSKAELACTEIADVIAANNSQTEALQDYLASGSYVGTSTDELRWAAFEDLATDIYYVSVPAQLSADKNRLVEQTRWVANVGRRFVPPDIVESSGATNWRDEGSGGDPFHTPSYLETTDAQQVTEAGDAMKAAALQLAQTCNSLVDD